MNLKLGDKQIELSRTELSLSLNAAPTLSMFLKEERDAQLVKAVVGSGDKASLTWQGSSLEVIPYAFEAASRGDNESESRLRALLLEEALEIWFTTRPEASTKLQYGVYQNQAEVGGWTFLNSCLGLNVLVPPSSYKERIDKVLPLSACLIRPIRQDNQQYLETVIEFLQHHLSELVGWCAVHKGQEPLRLIFFDEETAIQLDESWENLSANLPVRFASKSETTRTQLRKTGQQIRTGSKMALLQELAKHGIQTPLAGFFEQGQEKDLLYLPGPVKLGKRLLLCEAITYSFEEDLDVLTTTLDLNSGFQTPASTAVSSRLEGLFKAWDADDQEEKRVFLSPPDDGTWQMMDAEDANLLDPNRELMAEFIIPTTPNEEFAGLYVKRVEGDQVVFKVQPFTTPIIYGSFQKLTLRLEDATLSLNTKLLALSTSGQSTDLDDMHGVVANAKMIMNRTGSEVKVEADTISLVQNVQVKKDQLDIGSKTTVTNSVKMGKLKVTGISAQARALVSAARSGAPFCEECARRRLMA